MLTSGNYSCLIVDANAGKATGHHEDWHRSLTQSLKSRGVYCRTISAAGSVERTAIYRWYLRQIANLPGTSFSDVVLLSGDDALMPSLRTVARLRKSHIRPHYLLFRLSPQPRRFGRATLFAKLLAVILIKMLVPNATFYDLRMPVGRPELWRSLIGLRPVVDSSFLESRRPIGKTNARSQIATCIPAHARLFLVIGVLSTGKHVDTILEAWRSSQIPGAFLLFAGSADDECSALIENAAFFDSTVVFLPGRLEAGVFESIIESADVVLTLYRYSASSGIALRALTLGSRVVAGGSSVLKRRLKGVPNVLCIDEVTPESVAKAMEEAIKSPLNPPVKLVYDDSHVFPAPIVRSIAPSAQ